MNETIDSIQDIDVTIQGYFADKAVRDLMGVSDEFWESYLTNLEIVKEAKEKYKGKI